MATLTQWKEQKKALNLTNQAIANTANLPLRTVEQVMCGKVKNPRNDTVQAIERALGLAPTFTDEERALGVSESHLIALSDDDRELINLFAEAEEKLGKAYVRGVKQMVRLAIDTKGQP